MIATNLSKQNASQARNGVATFYQPTHIGIGRGGLSGGVPRTPLPSETTLANEILKKSISTVTVLSNKVTYEVILDTTEANGEAISEIALFYYTGAAYIMLGIDCFAAKNKTSGDTFTFQINEEF